MEDREDEIARDFIERAEEERINILEKIDDLIESKLPASIEDVANAIETFTDLARQMDIPFKPDEEMKDVIASYITNLDTLKDDLKGIELNEETLLNNSVMNKAQKIIPLIEKSLVEAKSNLYNSNKNNLLKGFKQREDIKSEIADLEQRKMYLQGKIDITLRKSVKQQIQEEMDDIECEIKVLESKLSEFEFKGDIVAPKNDTEIQTSRKKQENTKTPVNEEPEDGTNR